MVRELLKQPPSQNLPTLDRQMLDQVQALSIRITIMNELAKLISAAQDVPAILDALRQQMKWLIDYDQLSICLPAGEGRDWKLHSLTGDSTETQHISSDAPSILAQVLRRGFPYINPRVPRDPLLPDMRSLIIVPLNSENETLGALVFARREDNGYTLSDMRVVNLAAIQVANALRNVQRIAALQAAHTELETRNEQLDAYTYIIAHDLKAPLGIIYGFIGLIESDTSNEHEETRQYLRYVQEAAHQMNTLIDQLLWMASQSGQPLEVVPIQPVIERAMKRLALPIETRGIKITVQPELPLALGHSAWIEEVFVNLMGNAVKYIGAHNAEPHINVRGQRKDNLVVYEVEDNGIGIDEERIPTLFKIPGRPNADQINHGLGLALIARIIRRMGGEIGVRSELNNGSTFWFSLPAP